CRKLPALYHDVALQVAAAVPDAGQSVLDGLLRALPTLKPFVERATASASAGSATSPSLPVILPLTTALVQRAAAKFAMTTDQVLATGLTPAQDSQFKADTAALQPADTGASFF